MTDTEADRTALLLQMYRRRFEDIDRHIRVVWQSSAAVLGAFALFALVGEGTLPLDIAVAIVVLLTAWSSAQVVDASYWYNRNIVIIANIEREFLRHEDVLLIQSYFLAHRPGNTMITYLRIQLLLSGGLAGLMLTFHALSVARGDVPLAHTTALPYLVAVISLVALQLFQARADRQYAEFLHASPGRSVMLAAEAVLGHTER